MLYVYLLRRGEYVTVGGGGGAGKITEALPKRKERPLTVRGIENFCCKLQPKTVALGRYQPTDDAMLRLLTRFNRN